jgi:hypothetical protein
MKNFQTGWQPHLLKQQRIQGVAHKRIPGIKGAVDVDRLGRHDAVEVDRALDWHVLPRTRTSTCQRSHMHIHAPCTLSHERARHMRLLVLQAASTPCACMH